MNKVTAICNSTEFERKKRTKEGKEDNSKEERERKIERKKEHTHSHTYTHTHIHTHAHTHTHIHTYTQGKKERGARSHIIIHNRAWQESMKSNTNESLERQTCTR